MFRVSAQSRSPGTTFALKSSPRKKKPPLLACAVSWSTLPGLGRVVILWPKKWTKPRTDRNQIRQSSAGIGGSSFTVKKSM